MTTETLLLNRSMGIAKPEDYVQWAVERLCEEQDSPSLRILAGLNTRFELNEVETYFVKTCQELNIELPRPNAEPKDTAFIVKNSYNLGEISVDAALQMMAKLYEISENSDNLLWVWYDIEEERSLRGSGHEGIFYPPEALNSLEDVFETEWTLFERALRLNLPNSFTHFIMCNNCDFIGESQLKHKNLKAKIIAMIPWSQPKPPLWHTCARCGSYEYHSMTDPYVRNIYFKQLEGEQTRGADGV